ncbi:MAG: helix-hairpin-helix domain-containing protein [Gemmatimonadaceae bacterium]|nr:helix-hairpin-helix domain-containing protein [Gemmatimonadaceae bacterium]
MATSSEKQALGFLVLIALIGAGVQAVGVSRFERQAVAAGGLAGGDAGAAALSRQLAAVDSARAASPRGRSRGRRVANRSADSSFAGPSSSKRKSRGPAQEPPPIDVNTATAAELERLPRVGPALAQRMVAWRERHGPFGGPEDLRHVRGIGPSTVRLLLPLVTFSSRHSPLLSEGPPSIAPFLDDVV